MHASHRSKPTQTTFWTGAILAAVGGCLSGCLANLGRGNSSAPEVTDVIIEQPAISARNPRDLPGVHNVVTYAPGLVCGGAPDGEEGFKTLAAIGIKTVVSVDGAPPDLKQSETHGMRYVHLPIGYDTITLARQQELAQAISNLDGPIYIHCHHGKHRSGAGLATALVCSGRMSIEAVSARMHVSGTSPSYAGLWQAVRDAKPLSKAQLEADPASFPSITEVTGLVGVMAEIDQVIDLVRQSHEAKWRAPDDHPDLVAEKETQRLSELFKSLLNDEESLAHPAEYQRFLSNSIKVSERLDEAVRSQNAIQAAQMLSTLASSCKTCHQTYRNK